MKKAITFTLCNTFCLLIFFNTLVLGAANVEDFSDTEIISYLKESKAEKALEINQVLERLDKHLGERLSNTKKIASLNLSEDLSEDKLDDIISKLSEIRPLSHRNVWQEFMHRLKGKGIGTPLGSQIYRGLEVAREKVDIDPNKPLIAVNFFNCKLGMNSEILQSISLHLSKFHKMEFFNFGSNELKVNHISYLINLSRKENSCFIDVSNNSFTPDEAIKFLEDHLSETADSARKILNKFILFSAEGIKDNLPTSILWTDSWYKNHLEYYRRKKDIY